MMRASPSPSPHQNFNFFSPHTQNQAEFNYPDFSSFMQPPYNNNGASKQAWNKGRIPQSQYNSQTAYASQPSYAYGSIQAGYSAAPSISLQQSATPDATTAPTSRRSTPAQSPARTQFMGTSGGDWGSLYAPTSEPQNYGGNYLKVDTASNYLAPYQSGQMVGRNSGHNDDLPPLSASSRPSVSEGGYYSPLTPSTSPNPENGLAGIHISDAIPKTEGMENYSYNTGVATASRPRQHLPSRAPAGNNMPADLYHQAQTQHMDRTSSADRHSSPFRASSPFHPTRSVNTTSPVRHTASHLINIGYASSQRELQQEAQARAIQAESERVIAPTKTISPKEAFLEFQEPEDDGSKINLFAPTPTDMDADLMSQVSHSESQHSGYEYMDPSHMGYTQYDFPPPAMSGIPEYQYPMMQKPQMEHGGAYSCTEPGCTQRFPTTIKLSKHRREVHRQVTPGSNIPHHGMTTTAHIPKSHLPGPHKCTRTNPTTGKPCNTIFSRPYDLTRHEDTIHNTTREKARCDICNDEKTFSRQDALTRHKKVKHGIDK